PLRPARRRTARQMTRNFLSRSLISLRVGSRSSFVASARQTAAGEAKAQPREEARPGRTSAARRVSSRDFLAAARGCPRQGARVAGALAQAGLLDRDRKLG